MSEMEGHSKKPYHELFPRLMLKFHLNKTRCIDIFARENSMKYFDTYGDEMNPRYQKYKSKDDPVDNIILNLESQSI